MDKIEPWFVDICNFLVTSMFPQEASKSYKDEIKSDAKYYVLDDSYLWRFYSDKIIRRFSVPKALINDQGSHLYNKTMCTLLEKYRVVHQVATSYHPQINSQAELFKSEIKKLLQKMANPSRND
ncbi:hypothetical protein CR513_38767, partial [Mucuna pruriens]